MLVGGKAGKLVSVYNQLGATSWTSEFGMTHILQIIEQGEQNGNKEGKYRKRQAVSVNPTTCHSNGQMSRFEHNWTKN